jgi:hypothetical protein
MEDTYKQIIYKAIVLKKYQYKLKIIQSTTKVIQMYILCKQIYKYKCTGKHKNHFTK